MNRLSTRFALTLISVALGTVALLVALQLFIARPQLATFGQELGTAIDALLESPLRGGGAATAEQVGTLEAQLEALEAGVQTAFTQQAAYRRAQQRAFWLSTAFAALVAVVAGGLVGRRLARPVERVSEATARVAGGDLAARVPEPDRSSETMTQLAHNFNAMTETLQKLEEERSATLNDIAHDLRTPLTVVQGRLDAFADGVRPLTLENLQSCQHAVAVMTRLVGDLRTLALAEGGQLELRKERVNLSKVVRQVAEEFEDRARAKQITLSLHLSSEPIYLKADPDRLAQIVYNLLGNALTHTPQGGQVALYVLEAGGDVQLIVKDSGRGFAEQDLKQVMNRFYRADAAKAVSEGGSSGLGLAIVTTLTRLHGGRLEVANDPEGGAQLTVALPGSQ